MTFPVAFWLFAHSLAFRLGCLTMSNAMRSFADSNTFWAVEHFTAFVRALDFALRLLALDVADRVFGFRTRSVAFWRLADGITYRRAVWVVALP